MAARTPGCVGMRRDNYSGRSLVGRYTRWGCMGGGGFFLGFKFLTVATVDG